MCAIKPKRDIETYTPPASPESEQAVLGACLVRPQALPEIMEIIQPDDFYKAAHGAIYQAMCAIEESGEPVDLVTVSQHLNEKGKLEAVGGPVFLAGLSEQVGFAANVKHYAQVIREKSILRQLLDISQGISGECLISGAKPGEVIEGAANRIRDLAEAANIKKPKKISDMVGEWLLLTKGNFLLTDIYRDLTFLTKANKMACIMAVKRLEESGIIMRCGDKRGCYRVIEADAARILLNTEGDIEYLPLKWPEPFSFENLIYTLPGTVGVIAGSPDSGKTAFCLNFAKDNIGKMPIRYLTSEMGPMEMRSRVQYFDDISLADWDKNIEVLERSENFEDLVLADGLTIVDFLEVLDDFYMVGRKITHLSRKVKKGYCFIAIQKKIGAELGRGAEFSLERPRVYASLERSSKDKAGNCKLVKAKNWVDPMHNPVGKEWPFKLVKGLKFILWPQETKGGRKKDWEGYQ